MLRVEHGLHFELIRLKIDLVVVLEVGGILTPGVLCCLIEVAISFKGGVWHLEIHRSIHGSWLDLCVCEHWVW